MKLFLKTLELENFKGCKHTLIADTDLNAIEVQIGDEITHTDKKVYDLEGETKENVVRDLVE